MGHKGERVIFRPRKKRRGECLNIFSALRSNGDDMVFYFYSFIV